MADECRVADDSVTFCRFPQFKETGISTGEYDEKYQGLRTFLQWTMSDPSRLPNLDLGIPPGFDLLSEDLQNYQEKSAHHKSGHLSKV